MSIEATGAKFMPIWAWFHLSLGWSLEILPGFESEFE
jgi:hypothetical protein